MSATPDSALASLQRSNADLRRELAELRRRLDECAYERDEALQRETATAEVLQVINSSPGDLKPVFDAILEKARSLCGAAFGTLMARDNTRFHAVALHDVPEPFVEILQRGFEPHPNSPIGRLVAGEPLIHLPDLAEYVSRVP
jgi:hypothetical protein